MPAYICSFKKGSQGFRKIIGRNYSMATNVLTIPSVLKFKNFVGILAVEERNLKAMLGFWNFTGQSNLMREFLYKFFYNQLGLNTRVSHFVANFPRHCTLCSAARVLAPIPDETFTHLFFDCPTVRNLQDLLVRNHFP